MKATREGKRFILAAFLIGIAAINTGNNLIYLILSLMLSFILLSIVILRINLSGILLDVSVIPPVFAGEQSSALFSLKNSKRLLPAYSVTILSQRIDPPVYFNMIPPESQKEQEALITFKKRGIFRHKDFFIQSGFPFILFNKKMQVKVAGEVVVYPSLRDVDDIVPEAYGYEDSESIRMTGAGDEIYSLRDFRYGDDQRKIHWKASAKASSLLVKEYAEYEIRKVTIVLDNLKPFEVANFEKAVSFAASLSKYFLDSGYLVRVVSCRKVIPFGGGDEQLFNILDILSVIQEEDVWDCPISYDTEGYFILVLKSPSSSLRQYISSSNMVIYADTI